MSDSQSQPEQKLRGRGLIKMAALYDEYIRRLDEVNDETKTEHEHMRLCLIFDGWCAGVEAATGQRFNGDFHYIEKISNGEMQERPMCCGKFLDWQHQPVAGERRV